MIPIVLHTIADIRPEVGGPSQSVPRLCQALADAGVDVHLAAWTPAIDVSQAAPDFEPRRLHALGTASDGPRRLCDRVAALEQLIATIAPAADGRHVVLHDHGIWLPTNHAVAVAARKLGLPRIVSPRGMLEPWSLSYHPWRKRIASLLYQRRDLQTATALHATAPAEGEQFRRLGLRPPVVTIPNGIEAPSQLPPRSSRGDEVRTALYLGRIHPKKGLDMLVEAWSRVRPHGWRMRIVGPDERQTRAALESLVRQHGLGDDWEFLGEIRGAEKWQHLVDADLLILPTRSENFGLVVGEALAAGTPVLTTTAAPWSGLLERNCGWWVEPSVAAITAALAESTAFEPSELQARGARGKAWVADRFSWDAVARRFVHSYKEHCRTVNRTGVTNAAL